MPPFSVSHIAWSPEEEADALVLLKENGIHQMEVAPGRIWPDLGQATASSIKEGMRRLEQAGVQISGFQAILFGKPDLLLFDDSRRPGLLDYLKRLAEIAAHSGAGYLVFGAPKNRWIPEGLDRHRANEISMDFMKELGACAAKLGVTFGIEANPAAYGCNFCTHVHQVAHLVRAVDSPGIRWHLDTGELAMNAEEIPAAILDNADLIGSMHVSEPNLGDFSAPWAGHSIVASAIRSAGYKGPVSLEMKRPEAGLSGVRQAVSFLLEIYS